MIKKFFIILILFIYHTIFANSNNGLILKNVSPIKLYGFSGKKLENNVTVKVLDESGKPLEGYTIQFEAINFKDKVKINPEFSVTNKEGIATTEIEFSKKISNNTEIIIATSIKDNLRESLYFYITIHEKNWIKFLFFSLFGGLAIFLYGMEITKIALQKVAGRKMKAILSTLTTNRFMGVLVGIFITAIIQSSSATTVLLVGFVSAGLMTFMQSMAVSMGAGIGTTITVQLIAFKLTDYALLLIFIGFLMRVLSKNEQYIQMGSIIMGFGMVFFGIKIMSDTMKPLREYQAIINFLATLKEPFNALIVGTIFTAIIQSSGATLGILIALASQGLITLGMAIPLVFGANIGTTITAVLASIGANAEAKKTAYWHTFYKAFGVILFYPFMDVFSKIVEKFTAIGGSYSLARQIANAHTIFNLIIMGIFIWFLKPLSRIMDKLVPDTKEKPRYKPHYINSNLLNSPSLALEQAYREILHMSNIVEKMIINIKPAIFEKDMRLIDKNIQKDDKVDLLEEKLTPFLTAISRKELNDTEAGRQRGMLFIVNELEHIGDIITKQLMKLAQKITENDLEFSKEGTEEIIKYYEKTLNVYRLLLTALRREDHALAEEIVKMKPQMERESKKYHLSHIKRLEKGKKESVETSAVHLDIIDCLYSINLRIVDIAETIVEEI